MKMIVKRFVEFVIFFGLITTELLADDSFFELEEQHDSQVPMFPNSNFLSQSRASVRKNLIEKLLVTAKEPEKHESASKEDIKFNVISRPELLEIRDLLLDDDRYKPWGAASIPSNDHSNQVILDKIDDELFAPTTGERHSYDDRSRNQKNKPYYTASYVF